MQGYKSTICSKRWTRSWNSGPQKCVAVCPSLPHPRCKLDEPDGIIRNFYIQKLNQVFLPYKCGVGGGQGREETHFEHK